jgi:antitoxin component YwqK of YwqJK toxin-antitoxin module
MSDETTWKRSRYSNGQLSWETPYVNGERHGISRGWHENGQLMYETPWLNGQRHGIRRHWNEDDKLWSIEKFHRDQRVIDIELGPVPSDATMELDLTTNIMTYE